MKKFSKQQTERDEKFYSAVAKWTNHFKENLSGIPEYKERLMELVHYNDNGGDDKNAKITALQILIHKDEIK